MPVSEAQKRAIKKYQEKNRDKMLEYTRRFHEGHPQYRKQYYWQNVDKERAVSRRYQKRIYDYRREAEVFRRILLEPYEEPPSRVRALVASIPPLVELPSLPVITPEPDWIPEEMFHRFFHEEIDAFYAQHGRRTQ